MKKLWTMLLVLVLCTGLAACGAAPAAPAEKETDAPSHVHESGVWDRDAKLHWQICSCGEKVNEGEHALDEALICTVCGTEVWEMDDGSASLYNYNENYEVLRMTDYDPDGNVLFDQITEMEYDADGNKVRENVYESGVLVEEREFAPNADGEWIPAVHRVFYDDGTSGRNEYDENGNVVRAMSFDENGVMLTEEVTEYILNADGWYQESKVTLTFEDGEKHISEYNEYGDKTVWMVCLADGTVQSNFQTEYTYDEDGNMLTQKTDYTGERVDLITYTYDQDGNLILEVMESTDGTAYQMEYRLADEDWNYCFRYTETGPEGTIVREYDEMGDTISEVHYDVDGNEIPAE